jgi:hypothetical protein
MFMRNAAIGLVLLAVACSPGAPSASGPAAAADVASFMGTWERQGSIVVPWFGGEGFAPEPDADIAATPLVLAEASSSGPAKLTCAAASYEVASQPVEGAFGGKLADKSLAASALGITGDSVTTLTQTCKADTGEVLRAYYLADKNALLVEVDNTIYQFGRPGTAPLAK